MLEASPERLRSVGLSRPKASYILGIAQKALDGHIPTLDDCDRMTDDELISRLTGVKGVGRWTVEMLLIFNLGRPDVLPVHDLGVRKGFQFAYRKRKLPEPEQLARFSARWAPYRTTAAWYLWHCRFSQWRWVVSSPQWPSQFTALGTQARTSRAPDGQPVARGQG